MRDDVIHRVMPGSTWCVLAYQSMEATGISELVASATVGPLRLKPKCNVTVTRTALSLSSSPHEAKNQSLLCEAVVAMR
jgi:hypothetical protein